MQITSLPATTNLSANDVLAVEVNGVTYKITASTLASMLQTISGTLSVANGGTGITSIPSMLINLASATAVGVFQASPRPGVTGQLPLVNGGLGMDFSAATNAGFHNSIYRGKNLGTSFTSAQSAAITAGTFDDMFVGDYWVINGVNWRIADFDTYYRCGDTQLLTHHVVVVPDTDLVTSVWNETSDTSVGYVGSTIRTNIKASGGPEDTFKSAFGSSHVLNYRNYYPTAYNSSGIATAAAWTDACVELMNDIELMGSFVSPQTGTQSEIGISKQQFSLFRAMKMRIIGYTSNSSRENYWLRTVNNASQISTSGLQGIVFGGSPTQSRGVRPFALIA